MSKDFENKAKQLGDDFKLQPRENVWMRIEEALDKNKRRRIVWWWWAAPVALLLGSGVWWYASQSSSKTEESIAKTKSVEATTQPATIIDPKTTTNNDVSLSTQKETTKVNNQEVSQEESEGNKAMNSPLRQHDQPIAKSSRKQNTRSFSDGLDRHAAQTNSSTHTPSNPGEKNLIQTAIPYKANTTNSGNKKSNEINITPAEQSIVSTSEIKDKSEQSNALKVETDSLLTNITTTKVSTTEDKVEVDADNKPQIAASNKSGVAENKNKGKATWLLQAGAGMSNMGSFDQFLKASIARADQLQNSANPSVIVPTPVRSDKAGLSMSLGVQRKQDISNRWQWSASLAWQYQQIKQYKGVKVDSTISLSTGANNSNNYYYTAGSNSSQNGSNHRILLTNELSWQMIKNQPWLRLGAGIYTGYNISNNYFVRDNMQRLVKNDGLYNKWFVGITPSLQFELKNNIKLNLNTRIDFTKAYKELNGYPKYWRGWEVRADFPIFNK